MQITCDRVSSDYIDVDTSNPAEVYLTMAWSREQPEVLLTDRAKVETLRNALSLWLGSNGPAVDLLNELNNWLVCSAIATPEDMAQSFETFQEKIDAVLGAYRPSEVPQ